MKGSVNNVTMNLVFLGHALECYSCRSDISWEDCDSNAHNGTCRSGLDNCAKLYARGNGQVFARGCDTSYECSNQLTCKELTLNECSLYCCKDDFCNGSVVRKIRGFVFTSSFITAITFHC